MRLFSRRYRIAVHFPTGMGVEHSGVLTFAEARVAFANAQRRARQMPGMVVRVHPLIGGGR